MKKFNLVLSSLTLVGLLSFAGCSDDKNSTASQITSPTISDKNNVSISDKHTVTLVLNNGKGTQQRQVAHGKTMSKPLTEKEYYVNVGWYTDEACEKEVWNFATDKVTEDITLYAKWDVDYDNWSWRLARHSSKATLMFAVDHYEKYENGKYSGLIGSGFGSGVVIDERDGYYYALTNNHVVSHSNDKTNNMINGVFSKIVVYDHYMNPYTCELLNKRNDYDLALVKFSTVADSYNTSPSGGMLEPNGPNIKDEYKIRVAKFAADNPKVGDHVASYGSPLGQPHVVTTGQIKIYGGGSIYDNPNSVSNVYGKDVIHHTASILSGNSGGPLFGVEGVNGTDCLLVGINYGSSGSNDTYLSSDDFWAVPINLVREYIDLYVETAPEYDFLGEL